MIATPSALQHCVASACQLSLTIFPIVPFCRFANGTQLFVVFLSEMHSRSRCDCSSVQSCAFEGTSLNPSLGSPPLIQREGMKHLLKPRIFLLFSVQCTCTQNRRRVAETLIAEFFNLSNPFHPDVDLYDFEQNTLC